MKFYYGNDYKEALANKPVEIRDSAILEQYLDTYQCVMPAGDLAREESERNISGIILDIWDSEEDVACINVWVSYIMTYGYSEADIRAYAATRDINIDWSDCDPDYEYDAPGALVITSEIIESIREEVN